MAHARTRSRTPRTSAPHPHPAPGILRRLGVVGFDALEPVILAALATETPLLLIGPHGTAKSLLLTRLCEAMGLVGRHYNASLVNYDDLIGYPLPDEGGRLRFVQTPASVWDAEAVFVDELSRARPDMLNRLFPIVHERKVQGMPLERLRFRWAAMNPPPPTDATGPGGAPGAAGHDAYLGSEPLDPALADRFGFVVEVPAWGTLSADDQRAVITASDAPPDGDARRATVAAIAEVTRRIPIAAECHGAVVADAVRELMRHAATLGLPLSGRRAAMLHRNILAVHAARLAAHPAAELIDSSWAALAASLPQRAQGMPIDLPRLMVAHTSVWKLMRLTATDPRRLLACEADPVRRALAAVAMPQLSMQERSSYVADALAHLPPGGRHALGHALMEGGGAASLITAVAEQCAQLSCVVTSAQCLNRNVATNSPKHEAWKAVLAHLASRPASDPDRPMVGNLLAGLYSRGTLETPAEVAAVVASWTETRARFAPPPALAAA